MESVKDEYKQFLNTPYGVSCYNEFKSILYSNPDSLINRFNNEFFSSDFVPDKNTLNICDIGGGDGKRIIQILQYLNQNFNNNFYLDFIEQSEIFCSSFIKSKNLIQSFSRVTIQNRLFEDAVLNKKYDFIFLIHSIFSLQNPSSINRLLSLVNSDGKIILFSNAQNSFLYILKKELDQEYPDQRLEIDDVKNNLKKMNIKFHSYNFFTNWTINKNEFRTNIIVILEWLSLGKYKYFSDNRKNKLFNLILSLSEYKNEKYHFKENEEIVIIHEK